MWSKAILCRFRQPEKNPLSPVSQGFAAFRLILSRIQPRHSQSKRATNCANPGFLVIQFCTRCGQTCGQAVFLTTLACGGNACIAGVSMDCEDSVFRLEGGATRSQRVEMSRNVQSGNTQNLKSMVIQRSFPKWSVAERRKTAAASDQAAVCACAHSRYFAGGSPSGLRV